MLYLGVLFWFAVQPVCGLHGDVPGCHAVLLARVVRRSRCWEHAGEHTSMDKTKRSKPFFLVWPTNPLQKHSSIRLTVYRYIYCSSAKGRMNFAREHGPFTTVRTTLGYRAQPTPSLFAMQSMRSSGRLRGFEVYRAHTQLLPSTDGAVLHTSRIVFCLQY